MLEGQLRTWSLSLPFRQHLNPGRQHSPERQRKDDNVPRVARAAHSWMLLSCFRMNRLTPTAKTTRITVQDTPSIMAAGPRRSSPHTARREAPNVESRKTLSRSNATPNCSTALHCTRPLGSGQAPEPLF